MPIDPATATEILAFVDAVTPPGCTAIWLTGRPEDDTPRRRWQVVALHPAAAPMRLGADGPLLRHLGTIRGGQILEIVVLPPAQWDDPHWADGASGAAPCRETAERLR